MNLENLAKIGQLKVELYNEQECKNLIQLGEKRFKDALNGSLTKESRFTLLYDAAHSFALAALRRKGYRSTNRYSVFQALPITLGISQELWRILDTCHNRRNIAEYEGNLEIDDQLLQELSQATQILFEKAKSS